MLGDHQQSLEVSTQPVIGWRFWRLVEGQLVSPDQGTPWPQDGRLVWDGACRCCMGPSYWKSRPGAARTISLDEMWERWHMGWLSKALVGPPETAVQPGGLPQNCYCGINSYKSRELAIRSAHANRRPIPCPVMGQVELTGVVRVYENGWRAEQARVVALELHQHATSDMHDQVRKIAKACGARIDGTFVPLPAIPKDEPAQTPVVATAGAAEVDSVQEASVESLKLRLSRRLFHAAGRLALLPIKTVCFTLWAMAMLLTLAIMQWWALALTARGIVRTGRPPQDLGDDPWPPAWWAALVMLSLVAAAISYVA
jgi:hypothetical protein